MDDLERIDEDKDLMQQDQDELDLDDWEREGKRQVLRELRAASPEAVQNLRRIMKDANARESRQASQTILDRTGFPAERRGEAAPIQQNNLQTNICLQEHMIQGIPALARIAGMDEIEMLLGLAGRGTEQEETDHSGELSDSRLASENGSS